MLDIRNWTFSSPNLCMRAIVPPHSKVRLNRTIRSGVIAKNDFHYGVRPPSWIWEFLKFSHVSVAWVKICVCIAYQISSYLDDSRLGYEDVTIFQNGGRPPCWIFEIWHFHHQTFVCVRLCFCVPNFVLIGQYGDITIFKMADVRHVGYSKLDIFNIKLLYACDCASSFQISS